MNISIHRPITLRHKSIQNFSFFLAGIIDGDGHFSKIPQLVIYFHEKDIYVAYFLKKRIQYGVVSKVKNKKAIKFVISHSLGLKKVCNLIYNKLQHNQKILQYNTRVNFLYDFQLTEKKIFSLSENSWFSGFFLSDGSFQIKIIHREKRKLPEIRLVIQIDQKEKYLLSQIQNEFGGSIGFRPLRCKATGEKPFVASVALQRKGQRKETRGVSQNTYYYSSVNFTSAKKIINYFDKFHLMGVKQTQYVLWRKVYIKIQEKFHLTNDGVKWINDVKQRMSKLAK